MNIAYIWQREDVEFGIDSGPTLHVKGVIKALQSRGHQLRLITYHKGYPAWTDNFNRWQRLVPRRTNSLWFRYPERTIRFIQNGLQLPYARLFDSMRFADSLLPVVRDCDLVYERHDLQSYGGLLATRLHKLPLIYELNGDIFEEYREHGIQLSRSQWALTRQITRQMYERVDSIIAVSDPLRESTLARWRLDPTKVTVVTNGYDVDAFASQAIDSALLARWGLRDQVIITYVGAFQPWHSVDLIIQAFSRLHSTQSMRLLLIGDGPEKAAVETLAEELALVDRIVFTGHRPHDEVAQLLLASHITVLANPQTPMSLSTMPLKLLEYMAAGTAVVAPRTPNVADMIEDGRTGVFFQVGDSVALADTLDTLIRDKSLRERLGEAARREAIENYSWDRVAGELEAIFLSIVGRSRATASIPINIRNAHADR